MGKKKGFTEADKKRIMSSESKTHGKMVIGCKSPEAGG
jgi:hypothetical protein